MCTIRRLMSSGVLALLVLAPTTASAFDAAADEWEATLTVDDGRSHAQASLGMRPTATDGYDALWEVRAMLGSGVRALFHHPGWPAGDWYVRDVYAPAPAASYTLTISNAQRSAEVSLVWDLRHLANGCRRVDLQLTDLTTGDSWDLRQQSRVAYQNTDGADRTFRVDASVRSFMPTSAAPRPKLAIKIDGKSHTIVRWRRPLAGLAPAAYNVYRVESGREVRCNDLPVPHTTFHDFGIDAGSDSASYVIRALDWEMCEGPPSEPILMMVTGAR